MDAAMTHHNVICIAIGLGVVWIRRAYVCDAIVRIVDRITARSHDIGDEPVRMIHRTRRIIHKFRLSQSPLFEEFDTIGWIQRPDLNFFDGTFTMGKLGLGPPPAAELGDAAVVFGSKAILQVLGTISLIHVPSHCSDNEDSYTYSYGLPNLHNFSPEILPVSLQMGYQSWR
jgi:hypothetical protein